MKIVTLMWGETWKMCWIGIYVCSFSFCIFCLLSLAAFVCLCLSISDPLVSAFCLSCFIVSLLLSLHLAVNHSFSLRIQLGLPYEPSNSFLPSNARMCLIFLSDTHTIFVTSDLLFLCYPGPHLPYRKALFYVWSSLLSFSGPILNNFFVTACLITVRLVPEVKSNIFQRHSALVY